MYAVHEHPFFNVHEEQSGIYGNFGNIKSVAQVDEEKVEHVDVNVENITEMKGLITEEETHFAASLVRLPLLVWQDWCT